MEKKTQIVLPYEKSVTIDCDADPKILPRLNLTNTGTEHRKMGLVTLEKRKDGNLYANDTEIVLHKSLGTRRSGKEIREELKDKRILNACVRDALLNDTRLIPDSWWNGQPYTIYFWGTIFYDERLDRLCVSGLYWTGEPRLRICGGQWHQLDTDLVSGYWYPRNPAAILAE